MSINAYKITTDFLKGWDAMKAKHGAYSLQWNAFRNEWDRLRTKEMHYSFHTQQATRLYLYI